jgi:ubiquitin-protein ligase E3 C
MSIEDQANLLKFVTSCARQPLLGFRQLNPRFCIQKIPTHEQDSIDELNRRSASAMGLSYTQYVNPAKLPSAGTCMNLLKLPEYSSIEMLREKLLYAIRSQSGFELT